MSLTSDAPALPRASRTPLARRLGTSLPDVSFRAFERMAARRLGLWSPVLRGPVAGDPPNDTICGFARGSGFGGGLTPEVAAFLDAGPPPVVVGLGSVFALVSGAVLTAVASVHRVLRLGEGGTDD